MKPLDPFLRYMFDLRDAAVDAASQARVHLTRILDEGDEAKSGAAMEQIAHREPYARWWMKVTNAIELGDLDPRTALTKARTAARQSLLQTRQTPPGSLFTTAQSLAATEATRHFYQDTASFNLKDIPGATPTTPTSAPPAAPCTRTTATPRPPAPQHDPPSAPPVRA
jgi:hypothetical protein